MQCGFALHLDSVSTLDFRTRAKFQGQSRNHGLCFRTRLAAFEAAVRGL